MGRRRQGIAGQLAYDEIDLGRAKIGGIIALSAELLKFSTPSAELMVRDELIRQIGKYSDQQFLDPSIASVLNTSPGAVTNGITPVTSAGTSVANITADFLNLLGKFTTGDIPFVAPVLLMKPATALALSLKRTSADLPAFSGITVRGGTLFGVPVICSSHVPGSVSGGNCVILIDADSIFLADDSEVEVDLSREASLQMDSSPSSSASTEVSLFQSNQVGIKANRLINWCRRHDAGVTYIDGTQY